MLVDEAASNLAPAAGDKPNASASIMERGESLPMMRHPMAIAQQMPPGMYQHDSQAMIGHQNEMDYYPQRQSSHLYNQQQQAMMQNIPPQVEEGQYSQHMQQMYMQ